MRIFQLKRYYEDTFLKGVDPRWEVQVDFDQDTQQDIEGILDQLRAMELGLTE